MPDAYKKRWKGLNRAAGYINPYDVWRLHPDAPALIDTSAERFSKDWFVYSPRDGGPRKSKGFDTFVEAKAWARRQLGIRGWERASVNGFAAWFPNDDSPDEACEIRIHQDWSSYRCGRPAVPGETEESFGKRVPACSMHVKARDRRRAADAARYAEYEEREQRRERERENERAAEDFAARLRGFGLKADVAYDRSGKCHGSVALHGETGVALMEWIEMTCRDLGIEMSEVIEDITKGGRT